MPRRARIPAIIAIVLLASATQVAATTPVPIRQVDRGPAPLVERSTGACQLQPGPMSLFSYVWDQPNYFVAFAWRIGRQACATCAAPQGLELNRATIRLNWVSIPCVAHLRVSVVAARGGAACPAPDTTLVLCPAFEVTLTSGVEEYDTYTIPFPQGCCVSEDAFVL